MKKRINILQVTLCLEIGGLESLIIEICKHIDKTKFNIEILCLMRCDPIYRKILSQQGISVHILKKNRAFDIPFIIKFVSFLRHRKINILHTHSGCFFDSAICSSLAGGVRSIYTAHGLPLDTGCQSRIEDNIASLIIDRIIAVSDEIKADLQKRLPFSKRKINLIINGVNTSIFQPIQDQREIDATKIFLQIPLKKKVIGSVGRLEDIKNYDLLLRVFAKLAREHGNNVHLVLVGDGDEREKLENTVRDLDIFQNTSFLGIQYDIQKILPIFDVFALTSLSEGTCISLLEAQACGIPAVVTNVGGNSKIIKDGYNGFLCRKDDLDDIVRKIIILLVEDKMHKDFSIRSRNKVLDDFNLSSMVRSYENLFEMIHQQN